MHAYMRSHACILYLIDQFLKESLFLISRNGPSENLYFLYTNFLNSRGGVGDQAGGDYRSVSIHVCSHMITDFLHGLYIEHILHARTAP